MATKQSIGSVDPEIVAISVVYDALKDLEPESRARVLDYVADKLGTRRRSVTSLAQSMAGSEGHEPEVGGLSAASLPSDGRSAESEDGINILAHKWMRRSGIEVARLAELYSVGAEEIDLVAKKVPGKSKRQRMHNVLLLKSIAAYLAGGAARVSHDQLKETCLHYDAFDAPNFAAHLKSFSSEVSGSKQAGYTLTQRGLAAATKLVKELIVGSP